MTHKQMKKIALVVLMIFAASVVPLVIMSFFSHACNDDYYYSIKTYHAIKNGTPLLTAAFEQVGETYMNWQGTFSAVFFFSFQPAIFGENFYFLTFFLLFGTFIAGSAAFWYELLCKWVGLCKSCAIIVGTAATFICIQLAPSIVQSMFWYNGGVYYTLFFSLGLILAALLMHFLRGEVNSVRIAKFIPVSVLIAAVIGGGNYVTALVCAIILFCTCAALFFMKKTGKGVCIAVVFTFLFIALAVSAVAPGNAFRAADYTEADRNPIIVIAQSFFYGAVFTGRWTTPAVLLFAGLISMPIYKSLDENRLSFRFSGIVTLFSFCVFSAQFAPTVYGMNTEGEGRIQDIRYYFYIILVVINIIYWCGWLKKRKPIPAETVFTPRQRIAAILTASALALSAALFRPGIKLDKPKLICENVTTISAMYSLLTGEAVSFDRTCDERIRILLDDSVTDAVLPKLSAYPSVLFYSELSPYPDYEWSSRPMAEYFGKESVCRGKY